METIRITKPKARKEYRCDWCGQTIKVGEVYGRQTLSNNGEIYEWKNHIRCSKIATKLRMFDECDEGLDDDHFQEWIGEEFKELKGNKIEKLPKFAEQLDFVCKYHQINN